jgi:sugar lactone lactonase YvrE
MANIMTAQIRRAGDFLGLMFLIAASISSLSAGLCHAAPGDLFVTAGARFPAQGEINSVFKFDQAAQRSTVISSRTVNPAPYAIVFDSAGNMYVSDTQDQAIYKYAPDGTKTTFTSSMTTPVALVFDHDGNLFSASVGDNAIYKYTPDGTRNTFASGLNKPQGLAFDKSGNLFESDNGTGTIFKFTSDGSSKTVFASGISMAEGLAFDKAGNLYVAQFNPALILKYGPDGSRSLFTAGQNSQSRLIGLAFDNTGNLFAADTAAGLISKVAPDGTLTIFASETQSPTHLAFQPPTGGVLNISTRMRVLSGDNALIAGFIITGTDPKKVLIRGLSPSLKDVGITLSDPHLELHQGGTTVATNDNWKTRPDGASQQAEIEATTIPPPNDLESALVATIPPGNYTAILAGKNGETGVGLVEVYDLTQGANSQLANISTRGFIDTGDNVMIGGFIVGGGGVGGSARVIVRAIGPSLGSSGIQGVLQDPTLELHNGSGTTVASNDNWKTRPDASSQQAEIEATTIPPASDLESALVQTLPPGNYTAVVRGKNNSTGVGLVEIYNLH